MATIAIGQTRPGESSQQESLIPQIQETFEHERVHQIALLKAAQEPAGPLPELASRVSIEVDREQERNEAIRLTRLLEGHNQAANPQGWWKLVTQMVQLQNKVAKKGYTLFEENEVF